jgi:dTMP kinase
MAAPAGGAPVFVHPSYRSVLGNRRFRALWYSQFVSGVGDWLVIGLLIPLVTTLSGGSSFAVAGIMIAKIIPSLIFSAFIGVLVDRFDRRRLMIACDIARAALTLVLLTTNSLAIIYLTVLSMEIASLFFNPARNALIPHLVEEDQVTIANGLSYTTQQASMLVGLTMSGAILAGFEAVVRALLSSGVPLLDALTGPLAPALLGPRAGVILNSLTFIVSASLLLTIHMKARVEQGGRFDLSLLGKDAIDSFRFLGEHRELRGLLLTVGMAILGGGSIITVGLVHVQSNLSGGIPILEEFAVLDSLIAAPQTFVLVFLALGMVAGAVLVPRLARILTLQLLFIGAVAIFGAVLIVFALSSAYWMTTVFGLLAGFCIACLTVAGNTYIVRTVSDEIRGRVFTAMESVIRVSLLLSLLVMAPVGDIAGNALLAITGPGGFWLTGPRLTLLLAGLVVLTAAAYGYKTLSWRHALVEDADGSGTVT